jgi:beta-glucosidase
VTNHLGVNDYVLWMDVALDPPWSNPSQVNPSVANPSVANPSLAAPARAELLLAALTMEEKIGLVHSPMGVDREGLAKPPGAVGSAGHNAGVPRLGVPPLDETDASLGIANPGDVRPGAEATALPSGLSLAAAFDPRLARATGAAIGAEARAAGFAVLLAGGVNLVREPRCGRNFEYLGEDALLAGTIAGESVAGIQSQGVISTVKHFAVNAQETGRMVVSSELGETAARESDLLAFELAIEGGRPGAVMSAYNHFCGDPCSQSTFLLTEVLKQDWGFVGFVMSDWGGTWSSVEAALAGLDRQSGENLDPEVYFGEPLLDAVRSGAVPEARLDDMVRRILVAMLSAGLMDPRPVLTVDFTAHAALARKAAARGAVLLANDGTLPLLGGSRPFDGGLRRLLVIGDHADTGVLSGGGSSQVTPPGSTLETGPLSTRVYHPSSLVRALQNLLPDVLVGQLPGSERSAALAAASEVDAVVVVAEQWTTEGRDVPDLSLPDDQDTLVAGLAAANPRTVVVLQTGGPVLMPWLDEVAAVLQGWYPGGEGGPALAAVLTGATEPTGRLPVTFPRDTGQLARPHLQGPTVVASDPGHTRVGHFAENYDIEGADVGYRWYEREGLEPLFWFGFGLAYTTFDYANLSTAIEAGVVQVGVDVTNTGARAGTAVPQFYAARPDGTSRLVGWQCLEIAPGETSRAYAVIDRRLLSRWDEHRRAWRIPTGPYVLSAGASAGDRPLHASVDLNSALHASGSIDLD